MSIRPCISLIGKYLLGGTSLDQTNELANLLVAGTNTYTSRQYQFNMGVNVDLSMLLRGLSFKTQYALDYSTSYNNYYSNGYATYEPQWGTSTGMTSSPASSNMVQIRMMASST